jgi:hypothetical protein
LDWEAQQGPRGRKRLAIPPKAVGIVAAQPVFGLGWVQRLSNAAEIANDHKAVGDAEAHPNVCANACRLRFSAEMLLTTA